MLLTRAVSNAIRSKKSTSFTVCVAALLLTFISISLIQICGDNPSFTASWVDSARKYTFGDGYKRPGYELPLAKGIPLRVMGVGASTVFGQESFDSTGWRRPLREKLVKAGNAVNMVGTQRIGKMIDNDVEAFAGARIDMVLGHVQTAIPKLKPNLIILYAGSNDNYQNATLTELFKRYYVLAQYMFSASPKATIVMGTLMPTTEKKLWGGEDRIADCNEQLRRVYQVMKREGKPIVLVDMKDADGVQIENLGWDHMHPTRAGYQIMARKFFEGVVEADARGFLRAPEPVDGIVDDGNSAPGRVDEAGKKALAAEQAKKVEEERVEEEAVLKMIEELRTHPWDGTAPQKIRNKPPPGAEPPKPAGPQPPPPPPPPPPATTTTHVAAIPTGTPAT